ncbi:galactose oxidase [Pedobacter sp.]|jgi:two-component SAPR family response regulator|uniref:galactose oxidase n=1 Tax=Pedobacter sp. TaxID=1411316 RepID=UPI002CAC49DD|nr:galactose oxidase [Pedobacter sp.]HWW40938.1 hypothetical protein [Pedobacter sp.]
MKLKFYAACFLFLQFASMPGYCQSYGLGFAGHEVVQDKRTSLDLSPEQPICLDHSFELSFDLSFMPGYADYFGYVFRLIDNNERNIDLVYDMRFLENKHFKLIIGDKVSDIAFDVDINKLYKNWYNLKFQFDMERQQLILLADGRTYRQKLNLKKNCYRILFGANNYKYFKIKDVPPMKVREVKISEDQHLSYYWPLDEKSGNKALERIKTKDASVFNPIWIKKLHYDWEMVKDFAVKGPASVAFNPHKEELYVVAEDSLVSYNLISHQSTYHPYNSGKQGLLPGNQSIFDGSTGQLFNFYMDQKLVANFNFSSGKWDKKYINPDVITLFWHPNKFYSALDSSIYMIGGYGQYHYSHSVNRYYFPDKRWSVVQTKGNFTPRYLSALGTVKGGAYILGGYGSATGEQILNPKNIYDLNFYDVKQGTFRKIFEIKPKSEDFAFANSMVVDEKSNNYYALTFPNDKYNSYLQLIEGSLNTPFYKLVGNRIPYAFHDINSFADLFYCPASQKYVAVTLFRDEKSNQTTVKIYTLYGPPEAFSNISAEGGDTFKAGKYLLLVSVILIGVFFFYRQNRRRSGVSKTGSVVSVFPAEIPLITDRATEPETEQPKPTIKNTIFLFGDMQLFDKDGEDITKSLSPLIRELFLVVLLYTIKWGRGISSEKLTEILWFDKPAESARNNRSVNIAKLKIILERIEGCQISKTTGYWKIDFEPKQVKIDYSQYLDIVNSKREIDKARLNELTNLIHRGGFLSNVEYDWLDGFKSEISNEIIDTYLHYAASIKIADDPEFLISLSNYIAYFDPVNEEAMMINCKALVHLGKHSLAKSKFETFSKAYKAIYGEDFKQSFQEILE